MPYISPAFEVVVLALMLVPAAIRRYRGGGLLPSLALGYYLHLTTISGFTPAEPVILRLGAALLFGGPAGLVGYAVGRVSARVTSRSGGNEPRPGGS